VVVREVLLANFPWNSGDHPWRPWPDATVLGATQLLEKALHLEMTWKKTKMNKNPISHHFTSLVWFEHVKTLQFCG